jgi:hypothetical protein
MPSPVLLGLQQRHWSHVSSLLLPDLSQWPAQSHNATMGRGRMRRLLQKQANMQRQTLVRLKRPSNDMHQRQRIPFTAFVWE